MRWFIDKTVSIWLLVLGTIAFAGVFGPSLDRHVFPVVDPFVVSQSSEANGGIEVEGWMRKRRDCQILEIYAVLHGGSGFPRITDIAFNDRSKPDLVSRPPAVQFWGPWSVVAPPGTQKITVRTLHRCHPLWAVSSEHTLWEAGK